MTVTHWQVAPTCTLRTVISHKRLPNCKRWLKPPPGASAWFNLAYVLQQASLHDEAEAAFRQALATDERMDRAWYGLGLALMHRRQFDEAALAFKRATVLQPMSPHAWYRLAEVWLALGKNDEAREVLLHLKQFEPKVAAQLEREFSLVRPEPVEGSPAFVQQRLRQAQPERVVRHTPQAAAMAPHAAP